MNLNEIFKDKKKVPGGFFMGFMSTFRALNVVSENKGLKKFFIIPFLLNIVILSSILYFSYTSIEPALSDLVSGDSWFFAILRFILKPLLLIVLAVVTIIIYSIIGNIVTAPFNDFLSLRVEEKLTGVNFGEEFSLSVIIDDIVRITLNIIKLIGIMILVYMALLILNIIPLIGSIIYTVLGFLVANFFLGFTFFDFPLERRRFVFGDKLKILWRYKFMTIGLGMSFFMISFIPIFGFLGLNLATVGGTTLFIDNIKPALKIEYDNSDD